MVPTCRRPGCGRTAAVAIRYDPVSCQLWLDPVNPDDHHGQFLCRDHAERLSPPRGWVVVDRRGAQTSIRTSAPVVTVPHVVSRRAARRRWGSFEEPTLEFTGDDSGVSGDLAGKTGGGAVVDVVGGALGDVVGGALGDVVGDVTVLTRTDEPESPPAPVPPEPPAVPPEPVQSPPEMRRASLPAQPDPEPEFTVPEPIAEPEPEVVADEVVEEPAAPVDDLTGLLKPTGGLLGRAFESTGHQRSALTIPDQPTE